MLDVLHAAEKELPDLMEDESRWSSLLIDYHPPTVERIWTQWGDYRINLHLLHDCEAQEALFHPHPWPSAMKIVDGKYMMEIGFGKDEPKNRMKVLLTAGSEYEMTDPDQWHAVIPVPSFDALTVMVTGKPWDRPSPKSEKVLTPLSNQRFIDLLSFFRMHYGRMANGKKKW